MSCKNLDCQLKENIKNQLIPGTIIKIDKYYCPSALKDNKKKLFLTVDSFDEVTELVFICLPKSDGGEERNVNGIKKYGFFVDPDNFLIVNPPFPVGSKVKVIDPNENWDFESNKEYEVLKFESNISYLTSKVF